jgi:hypothetical protein
MNMRPRQCGDLPLVAYVASVVFYELAGVKVGHKSVWRDVCLLPTRRMMRPQLTGRMQNNGASFKHHRQLKYGTSRAPVVIIRAHIRNLGGARKKEIAAIVPLHRDCFHFFALSPRLDFGERVAPAQFSRTARNDTE